MQYKQFKMGNNTFMVSPETGEKINIDGLRFRYWTRTGYLVETQGIDPTIFADLNSQYEYKNELNEVINLIDPKTIGYGIDTILEKGKFYSDPRFKDFIFYCEKVDEDTFTMFLLKSHQHGKLIRSEMKLSKDESKFFVEITDEKVISEGKNLYNDFVDYKENNPHTLADDISKMWVS